MGGGASTGRSSGRWALPDETTFLATHAHGAHGAYLCERLLNAGAVTEINSPAKWLCSANGFATRSDVAIPLTYHKRDDVFVHITPELFKERITFRDAESNELLAVLEMPYIRRLNWVVYAPRPRVASQRPAKYTYDETPLYAWARITKDTIELATEDGGYERTFTGKLRPYSLIRGLFGEGHLSSGGGGALVFSQSTQRLAVAPGIDPLLMTVYIVVLDCRQLLVNQHDHHGDV